MQYTGKTFGLMVIAACIFCAAFGYLAGYLIGQPVQVLHKDRTSVYTQHTDNADVWVIRLVEEVPETGHRVDSILLVDRAADEVVNFYQMVTAGDTHIAPPKLDPNRWRVVHGKPLR